MPPLLPSRRHCDVCPVREGRAFCISGAGTPASSGIATVTLKAHIPEQMLGRGRQETPLEIDREKGMGVVTLLPVEKTLQHLAGENI